MNEDYWFIVHSVESFKRHPDTIAFKENIGHVNHLKKGDIIVYYCKGSMDIKGIFVITEKTNESEFGKYSIGMKIAPKLVPKKEINFRSIVRSEKLDMFKRLRDISRWGACIQGRVNAVKPLSEHDFHIVEKYIKSA